MPLGGPLGNHQLGGDLAIAPTAHRQLDDLALAASELFEHSVDDDLAGGQITRPRQRLLLQA